MKHNFLELLIWKRSRILVKEIYMQTQSFPHQENFGLISQIRRSAISIPSNIAEGCGRGTNAQLKHFLSISIGSLCELETQIYLAYDLDYIDKQNRERLIKKITEIRKMTMSFKSKL